jgi:hypothetical protein
MAMDLVGELISFRGLVYAPINEQGVVYLFGKVSDDLHIYVETVRTAFPDCIGRRFAGRGWERIGIEFEFKSSSFKLHGHDPDACDMPVVLVCWEDDWEEDDLKLKIDQIIELRNVIKDLPNKPVGAPTQEVISRPKIKALCDYASDTAFSLYESLDNDVKTISEDIFAVVGRTMVSYYSPKWRFMSVFFLQNGLRLRFFVGGKTVDEVKPHPDHPNWGYLYVYSPDDIPEAIGTAKKSWNLALEAGKHNLDMTWGAKAGCFTPESAENSENDDFPEEDPEDE